MTEVAARYSLMRQFKCDLACMPHDPCPDLNQADVELSQGAVNDFLRQVDKVREAVRLGAQYVKLKPAPVVTEMLARQARPFDGVAAITDEVHGCVTLALDATAPLWLHRQIGGY
ncbi:MAG: hypothetical protein MK107_02705 [Oceanicola sp.]|nr:hypothetical protein [Oceanicola sp.]